MVGMPYVMHLAGFGIRSPTNPLLGYDVAVAFVVSNSLRLRRFNTPREDTAQ